MENNKCPILLPCLNCQTFYRYMNSQIITRKNTSKKKGVDTEQCRRSKIILGMSGLIAENIS